MPGTMDLDSLDRGRLRHPLWGDRKWWYDQSVPRGWWTDSLTRAADTRVRREIVDAVDTVLTRIGRG